MFDGLKIKHVEYGIGIINGVEFSHKNFKVGIDFKVGEDDIYKVFNFTLYSFIKFIFKRNINGKIKQR